MLTPGCLPATESPIPARWWPHPWGRLTTPAHHVLAEFHADFDTSRRGHKRDQFLSTNTGLRRIGRVDQQGAAVLSPNQPRRIVHPRVITAEMSPSDEPQWVFGRVDVETGEEPLYILQERGRRQLDRRRGVRNRSRQDRAPAGPGRRRALPSPKCSG